MRSGPVAAKTGQVLYDDSVDHISIYSRCKLIQPTAVKVHATYIVIKGLSHDGVPALLGKRLADFPLI